MDRSMIDATSGGALMDKTPTTTRHLISNMAGPSQSQMMNEIGAASNLRLENQLSKLTSLVRQLAVGQHQPNLAVKVCGICTFVDPTDLCPTLQETESDQPKNVGAIVAWKTTNSARTESRALCSSEIRTYTERTSRITICKLQQHAVPAKYERHHPIPQNADKISAGSSNLPSQTIPNPRGKASAVTLRSGKELSQPAPQLPRSTEADSEPYANSQVQQQQKIVPLSFPTWTVSARKAESDEELLKMFRKVEINIPLLDAIKQIPKYAKFLKELCVDKRKKMKGSVEVGGIVSALTKNEEVTIGAQALPKKC
ncbi:hypothetical protein CR513_33423, partial [Mucuna pruriens]